MAGTHYYFNNMTSKDKAWFKYFPLLLIIFILLVLVIIPGILNTIYNTSSPVEEMYHRQLVVTLDSILDARFGPGCCKEIIDSDDVSVPQTLFHNHSSMEMME